MWNEHVKWNTQGRNKRYNVPYKYQSVIILACLPSMQHFVLVLPIFQYLVCLPKYQYTNVYWYQTFNVLPRLFFPTQIWGYALFVPTWLRKLDWLWRNTIRQCMLVPKLPVPIPKACLSYKIQWQVFLSLMLLTAQCFLLVPGRIAHDCITRSDWWIADGRICFLWHNITKWCAMYEGTNMSLHHAIINVCHLIVYTAYMYTRHVRIY